MNQFTNELCLLAAGIRGGAYTRRNVRKMLDEIELAYPDETYPAHLVARKPKPWDMAYLEELEELLYNGFASRALLEYMAEVSEAVYRRTRIRHRVLYMTIMFISCAAVAVLGWVLAREIQ